MTEQEIQAHNAGIKGGGFHPFISSEWATLLQRYAMGRRILSSFYITTPAMWDTAVSTPTTLPDMEDDELEYSDRERDIIHNYESLPRGCRRSIELKRSPKSWDQLLDFIEEHQDHPTGYKH